MSTLTIVFLCPHEIKGGQEAERRMLGRRGVDPGMDLGCVTTMKISEVEKKLTEETEV